MVAPAFAIAPDTTRRSTVAAAHDLDRGDAEEAAAIGVEQGGKDARRVEVGQQYQSIVPSTATSATVWRSPMTPCSAIGG